MVWKQKYIKTKDNLIIVFPEILQHSDFKKFEPISAGFIAIGTKKAEDGYYETDCTCYGESVSLNIKSSGEEDSVLARKQILGLYQ